jgi:hypothetical protein
MTVVVFRRFGGDVAVGRSWTGDDGRGFDDHAPADLVDPARILELHVMNPAVNTVDDQAEPLARLVPGKASGQDPAHDLLA